MVNPTITEVPKIKPPKEVRSHFCRLYGDMKRGDIVGIAIAAQRRDGGISTAHYSPMNGLHILGAVEYLKHMILLEVER